MKCDPVGAADIALRLNVPSQTVATWHYRSNLGQLPVPMPPHRWIISGKPAWSWREIKQWAKETNRLP